MNTLTIKRNKVYVTGDVSNIDTSQIINWKPNHTFTGGSFDKNLDSVDNLCDQIKCKGDTKIREWYVEQRNIRNKALKVLNNNYDLSNHKLNKELKEYQEQAIAYFLETKRCIVGYSPGLGKTLISINCIKAIQAKKVLIVCPSYLKFQWQDEINKWTNDISSVVINGTKNQRESQINEYVNTNKNCLIVNYEQIRIKKSKNKNGKHNIEINMHDIFKQKWDLIIWDESHRLKTRDSQTTLGNYALSTDYRLMLTGTPVTKNPAEIWSLLRILDRNTFTNYWGFTSYYCNVVEGFRGLDIEGIKRPKEYRKLLQSYMIRKTKDDVAKDLPEKVFIEIKVEMSEKQKKLYNKAMKEYLKPDDNVIESDIERFIRVNQIAQNPCILDGENVSIVRDTTLDMIQDIPESIIIGCTYIKMSIDLKESIEKKYKKRKVYLINSHIYTKKRYDIVEQFKKDSTGILVTTIKCLSEGANLDCCNNMIITDIEWNCGTNEQFQNRIHRMTSTRIKNYYFIIVRGTVNEYKYQKIHKESLVSKVSLGDSDQNTIRKMMNEYKGV